MPPKLERCVQSVMNDAKMKARYPDAKERKSRAYAICTAATLKGGGMEYGYAVNLHEEVSERINALRVGNFKHPFYGDINITPERLQRFAKSVNERVRGVDLDIDYDHKEKDGRAAGWIKSAEVEDDRLWLTVDWNPPAKEAIQNGEYRYFSAEIWDEWEDSDGNKHEDIVAGGGLTNRPFIKDLAPLNFNELFVETQWDPYVMNDVPVNLPQLYRDIPAEERKRAAHAGKGDSFPIAICEDVNAAARSLGRAGPNNYDSATIKANIIRIAKSKGFSRCLPKSWQATEGVNVDAKKLAEILGSKEEDEDKLFEEVKALTEAKPDYKKFAEALGVAEEDETKIVQGITDLKKFRDERQSEEEKAKAFSEHFPDEAKQLAELRMTNKLQATDARLSEWKRAGLPPVVADQVRDFRMGLSDAQKFDEIIAKIVEVGTVKLSNEGGGNADPTSGDDAPSKKFSDLIDKKLAENKDNKEFTYYDAVQLAEKEEPELAKAYLRG